MLRTRCRNGQTYGPELVSNGVNFTATTDWTPSAGCTLSAAGGELVLTMAALASFPGAFISATTQVGRSYRLLFIGRRGTSTDSFAGNYNDFSPAFNDVLNSTTANLTRTFIDWANTAAPAMTQFAASGSAAAGTMILTQLSLKRRNH